MFDIRKEVPSLELCKKLKELGYPQNNGGWYWLKVYNRWRIILDNERFEDFWDDAEEVVKAPTVNEIEEWLPPSLPDKKGSFLTYNISLNNFKNIVKNLYYGKWQKYSNGMIWLDTIHSVIIIDENKEKETKPDIYAKMLLWLIENKYITFDI